MLLFAFVLAPDTLARILIFLTGSMYLLMTLPVVAILLTLLHLGIKNIRLGPSLPAFVTPDVLSILVEKFGIKPISTPKEDIAATLAA